MKSRRAISSVVGALFAVIALATTIGYVTYSLNLLADFNENTLVRNQQDLDTTNEKMEVVNVAITGGKFDITVQNTGNIPLNITRLWVTNASAINWVSKYDMDKAAFPGQTVNIGQDIPLTAKSDKSYDMKLVTDRGNTKEFSINNPGSAPLDIKLYALPDSVPGDLTTTILMTVTNNMSSTNTLLNITPAPLGQGGSAQVTNLNNGPQPTKYSTLKSGQTAYFSWIYRVEGTGGQSKTFTSSLQNGYPGNTASATVTITDISFSIQSGTAIESQGLSTEAAPDEILILHQETTDALTGRQMYSGAAENPVTYSTSTTQSLVFFTRNDTQQNVLVDPGKWNATLRMVSNEVPDGINPPDLIYHFEEGGTTVSDSSGNARDMTVQGSLSSGSNGRDGTQAYTFDGTSTYLLGPSSLQSGVDDIKGPPDSTSGWFKYTGGTQDATPKVIYRVGSDNNEYYNISIGNNSATAAGKLVFSFHPGSAMTPKPVGFCMQSQGSRVDDGQWHHFIAVRDGSYTCRLYIDGRTPTAWPEIDSSGCATNCGGPTADFVDPVGRTNIGRNATGTSGYLDFFKGEIDDVFHWNSYTFPSNKMTVFYNTNYGINAHKFDFKLERVTSLDAVLPRDDIRTDPNYQIKFWDGKGSASAWSAKERNYTTPSLPSWTFKNINDLLYGDRLKFTMTWKSGLNMSLRVDDPNLNNPLSSFIQVPKVNEAFPSYYTLDNDNNPQITVYNQGPSGSWVTYLTRITLDDLSSTNSYAGQIRKACTMTVDKNNQLALDSPLIKVGDTCQLEFEKPSNPPNAQGTSPIVPPGQYRMYVFMSGYDETGNIFLRTTYVGLVRVIE